MKAPVLMALLLAAAGLLHFAVTLPARSAAQAAWSEHRTLWAQQKATRQQLAGAERREMRLRKAVALASTAGPAGGQLAWLRVAVLDSLSQVPVSGVKLEVRAAASPLSASVHVTAQGAWDNLLRLAARVTDPPAALVLDHVRLSSGSSGLQIDLDAVRLAGRS